jgi:hypothetical protein
MSLFRRLRRLSKESVQVRGSISFFVTNLFLRRRLLAPRPTPKLGDHPLSFVAAAYSVHSQLPSIAGGRPSIRNLARAMLWRQGPT